MLRPIDSARLANGVLLTSVLLLVSPARGTAEPIFGDAPSWTSPVEATQSVTLGDVDRDGDLDLIRGNLSESTTLTLNIGGTFASSPAWTLPPAATRGVALGDVDGDGGLDLVVGNSGQAAALYLNTGTTFSNTPAWTGPDEDTRCVVLGDVDGDGDLDLVRGNSNQGSTLYLNRGGAFETTPSWAGPIFDTRSAALGDVDGDGDLDLVLGNLNQPAVLFLNSKGTFGTSPDWTGPIEATRMVLLADVDGDGDFDLVRGNFSQGATLYLGDQGSFATTPAWVGPVEDSYSVALGDLDGDGHLDLVRGNATLGATLYLGQGTGFAPSPAWTGPVQDTRSLALGDLDGDGDLDLVRGGFQQASTLYLNVSNPYPPEPAWIGPPEDTRSLALGDVDGDGDLDLVRGNLGSGATLTLNLGAGFASSPAWTGPLENTLAVALADVDRDGDLDLVRGNFDQAATLYLNIGGTFASSPAWMGPRETTVSVALADVDGDGDLDLVRGNFDQAATLYLNIGGTFASSPAWTGPVEATLSIALGDIDRDGDPDLVRGNQSQPTTIYLNTGGVFGATAAGMLAVGRTSSIALGDVDGDGDLDLVRGNLDQAASLYVNQGQAFSTVPAWTGGVERTQSVALGDLDGDGDLDLIRGNLGNAATIYLGSGGVFSPVPNWIVTSDSTHSIALGDVDRDGDLDAVLGRRLYTRRSPWIRMGIPARLLPDNPAHLRAVAVVPGAPNLYGVTFQAVDAESDSLVLAGEYQFEGGPWRGIELAAAPPVMSASPTGVLHEIEWDVTRIPFDHRPVTLRLHALPPPRHVGGAQFEPAYVHVTGAITPRRPSLAVIPGSITFPTLTVGDSATATIRISNDGNQDLVVNAIESSSPEIVVLGAAGVTIPPGQRRSIDIVLAPSAPLVGPDQLHIHGNDPANPEISIPLYTDVHALSVSTRLLAVAPELPLGQAATVVVTPDLDVRVETGYLLYRAHGAPSFSDSALLAMQGSNFIALVPGEAVTEAGLDYYVRVENSGIIATDPFHAPDEFFFQAVESPSRLASAPTPDARGVFPEGRPTPIVVSMPQGAAFVEGALYFRAGGEAVFDSVQLATTVIPPGIEVPAATLPATAVGPRGFEYWVRVHTLTTTLTDPAVAPSERPRAVRVTVGVLTEPAVHAALRYRQVSVPLDLDLPSDASLEALLSDQPEFGTYDVTRWRAFRYLPSVVSYLEVSGQSADSRLRPEPGRAFWLVTRSAHQIDTAPVPGRSTPTGQPFRITLEPGWNQIGNPFSFRVAWSEVRSEQAGAPIVLEPPVGWDETLGQYRTQDVTTLEPFDGYWLWNPTTAPIDLMIPPIEAPAETLEAAALRNAAPADTLGWSLQISVSGGGITDGHNIAAVEVDAREGPDAIDRTEAPMTPGAALSLYFLDVGGLGEHARRTVDARAPIDPLGDPALRGRRWFFDVARSGGESSVEAQLQFRGADRLPPGIKLLLIDRTLERAIDLERQAEYRFIAPRRGFVGRAPEARFELVLGSDEFTRAASHIDRPRITRLLPIFPNPVASSATVRFELARAGPVVLGLYDISGREVRTLLRRELDAGLHEITWSGIDGHGIRVPPGVYTLRLITRDRTETRKLVRVG